MANLWTNFWARSWWIKGPAIGVIAFIVIAIIAAAAGGGSDDDAADQVSGGATAEATATAEEVPATDEPAEPTSEPTAEPTPEPTAEPTAVPIPDPVVLEGFGQFATESIDLPAPISVATFTHNGSSNFIVRVFPDDELLINEIGFYEGSRPLISDGPIFLDIDADGAWTVRIEAMGTADSAGFSGQGAAVSGLFDPPGDGAWEIQHNGSANFIVYAHCAGGTDLVQNEIGAVSGSSVISFDDGPCFWEVDADGGWSLTPR